MSNRDAGFNTLVSLSHRVPLDLGRSNSRKGREVMVALANLVNGQGIGQVDAAVVVANQATMGACAGATLVISGGAGAVGGIINGVTITATHSSDTADGALIATAINASVNAIVQGFVRATGLGGSFTLASVVAGTVLKIGVGTSTYEFVAVSGTTTTLGRFDISGNDTADALSLAAAINCFPILNQSIRAESVAGVCHIYPLDNTATGKRLMASAATVTVSQIAAVARCHVAAVMPGNIGNAFTIALSGTGVTVANTNTRLVGGLGGTTGTVKRVNATGGTF